MASIIIVSSDPNWRATLQIYLELQPGLEVIGSADSILETQRLCAARRPDMIVASLRLADGDLGALAEKIPAGATALIAVIPSGESALTASLKRAGYRAWVDMGDGPQALLDSIISITGSP